MHISKLQEALNNPYFSALVDEIKEQGPDLAKAEQKAAVGDPTPVNQDDSN